jgi:hypothetical protein
LTATLTDAQVDKLDQAIALLGEVVHSLKAGDQPEAGTLAPAASHAREPKWVAEYRRSWGFLKALDDAGGEFSTHELSQLARHCGYDPRGLGGFYNGENASLRITEADKRVLTDAGRRYVARWQEEFGS